MFDHDGRRNDRSFVHNVIHIADHDRNNVRYFYEHERFEHDLNFAAGRDDTHNHWW